MKASSNDPACDLSIVVPTHKRGRALRGLLSSIQRYGPPSKLKIEVIVVDSSPRPSLNKKVLKHLNHQEGLRVLLVPTRERRINAKRNLGLNWARGPLALFLDDSSEVPSSEFLIRHVQYHHLNPNTAIYSGVYENTFTGLRSLAYSELHSSFDGLNFSMKIHSEAPWLRFNEKLSYSGTRELFSRVQTMSLAYVHEPSLIIKRHVRVSLKTLLLGAFHQGRSEVALSKQNPPPQNRNSVITRPLNLIFCLGITYEMMFPSEKTSVLRLFRAGYYTLFKIPISNQEDQQARTPYMQYWFIWRHALWTEFLNPIFLIVFKPYFFTRYQFKKRMRGFIHDLFARHKEGA